MNSERGDIKRPAFSIVGSFLVPISEFGTTNPTFYKVTQFVITVDSAE